METAPCFACLRPVRVTDESRKRFDGFVCEQCHRQAEAQITEQMPGAASEFSPTEVNFNGLRCAVVNRAA